MIANERQSAGWTFPTPEMLRDAAKGQRPVLKIDGFQLRKKSTLRSGLRHDRRSSDQAASLDWLPNHETRLRLPCQVRIKVHNATTEESSNDSCVYMDTRQTTIESLEDGSGVFNATFDKPFLIELEKINIVVEAGKNGNRRWQRSVTARYDLRLRIQCQDSDDAAELLSSLVGHPPATFQHTAAQDTVLRAAWSAIPECPTGDSLLDLSRTKDGRKLNTKYGLDLSIGWSSRRDSPLVRHNRHLRTLQNADEIRQLPTPSASEDLDAASQKASVTYVFEQERQPARSLKVDSLACPLCDGRTVHSSFDRLHFHLLTWHELFQIKVDPCLVQADELPHRVVRLSIARESPQSAPINPEDPEEQLSWIAPRRPFDLPAYLVGDDKWTGHTRVKAKSQARRGRPPREVSDLDAMAAPPLTVKRPAPEAVMDLPRPKRRKHRAPTVPGVRFYRTSSKRPVEPAESVSESDEEMDMSWLDDVQQRDLDELDLTASQREFIEDLNKHLDEEQPSSDVLARETIVRFARKYRAKMIHAEWLSHLEAKLTELLRHGILDEQSVRYCRELKLTLVQDPPTQGSSAVDQAVSKGHKYERSYRRNDNDQSISPRRTQSRRRSQGQINGDIGKGFRHEHDPGEDNGAGSRKSFDTQPFQPSNEAKVNILGPETPGDRTMTMSITPTPETKTRRKWDVEKGRFRVVDDDATLVQQRSLSLGTDVEMTPVRRPADKVPHNSTRGMSSTTEHGKSGREAVALAHRRIHFLRAGTHQRRASRLACVFLKDSVLRPNDNRRGRLAGDIAPRDFDFAKFKDSLYKDFQFDEDRHVILWIYQDHQRTISDEATWHQALEKVELQHSDKDVMFVICDKVVIQDAPSGRRERPNITTNGAHNPPKSTKITVGDSCLGPEKACLCAKPVTGERGSVTCDSEYCARGRFHLLCVNLDERVDGWRCSDCEKPD